ncbi:MAG TPA: DUF63 family protein [Candidatus Altiarchaeales archaeon]|nr:DUF63 family protein [Candidatus Altiarchaeales archaeon]
MEWSSMGVYALEDYLIYFLILLILVEFARKFIFFDFVKFDRNFIYFSLGFIPMGVLIRVLSDLGVFERSKLWSITPGVYILCFLICSLTLLVSKFLERKLKIDYWKFGLLFISPIDLILFSIFIGYVKAPLNILYPLLMSLILIGFLLALINELNLLRFFPFENYAIIWAHLLDASSTFIAHDFFGFGEEHLLSIFLINLFGTALILIPVKTAAVFLILYFVENWHFEAEQMNEEDETLYKIIKFLVFIFGIGPGLRNTLLLGV